MKLSQLLNGITVYTDSITDAAVKDVVSNASMAVSGTVFVAMRGERHDGHDYIKQALENGCEAVIYDEGEHPECIKVNNSRRAYAVMCANLYGNPQNKLHSIAVTGTNGKTTVTHMLKKIADFAFGSDKTVLIGGINNVIYGQYRRAAMTTPEPRELYGMMREAVDKGAEYLFAEASSHALSYEKLAPCRFDVGAFTNLSEDHLDYHITMENYLSDKCRLIPLCDVILKNNDDKAFDNISGYGFSLSGGDFYASDAVCGKDGVSFVYHGKATLRVQIPVQGRFNVYNALSAIACAELLGIDAAISAKALSDFHGAEGRFEKIPYNGADVIIDFAHTPDALSNALSAARSICNGRLWCVFGCGGERDRGKRPLMGSIASELSDIAIVTSDNSRGENVLDIISDILKGVNEKNVLVMPERRQAIIYALENSKSDDLVLLAGKGHENYEINNSYRHFSERELVAGRNTLRSKKRESDFSNNRPLP